MTLTLDSNDMLVNETFVVSSVECRKCFTEFMISIETKQSKLVSVVEVTYIEHTLAKRNSCDIYTP